MNRLTDRLQMIADEIQQGETMADIGTDHGFLPLYLWENGISPSVVMCDVSEPSLSKAKAAAGAYQFGHELDFRAGDGLQVIRAGEVDDIVIAGMGGLLIRDIMAHDLEKTCSFGKFILQPRNNSGLLRFWLTSHCFDIVKNQLVREGKFICEIITVKPPKSAEIAVLGPSQTLSEGECALPDAGEACWELPEDVFGHQPELASEYARVKLGIEQKILEGILRSCNVSESDINIVRKRIDYFSNMSRFQ